MTHDLAAPQILGRDRIGPVSCDAQLWIVALSRLVEDGSYRAGRLVQSGAEALPQTSDAPQLGNLRPFIINGMITSAYVVDADFWS